MKKNNSSKRGPQDGNHQSALPEKVGWVRKFCGKGIFREIWKNRYVVLRGDQLYVSEKEVKDEKNIQEVFDLSDYEKCEELRKSKSRSKKNHSKFTLAHSKQPGNTAPNLIFLAVSPEEKESWINALSSAITRAKNRILDEVTVEEDSFLAHPTRDRAKIQHSRRPPTRGHLMAVASTSTSDGMLTLDLIQEEDPSPEEPTSCAESFRVDLDKSAAQLAGSRRRADSDRIQPSSDRAGGPPRPWEKPGKGATYTPQAPKKLTPAEKGRCASLEEILSQRDAGPACPLPLRAEAPPPPGQLSRIQDLVARKLEKTQELLAEVQGLGDGRRKARDPPRSPFHRGPLGRFLWLDVWTVTDPIQSFWFCLFFFFFFFIFFSSFAQHIAFDFCTPAMGLQTTRWPSHGAFLLKSWLLISLGLCSQVSKVPACPSVCRCDRNFVYCNERSLTSVPLGIPEGVTVLYLHNNQINNAGFPAELHSVQSVHTVYLYGNQLDEFPMNLPRNVRVLHLQENNIQTISRAALAQLLKLEELHLDDNSISTVGVEDGAFREAVSLKLLFLSKNHLSSVPVGLPADLQELRVDENRIAVISDMAFQNLTSLERLIVDGNLLTNKGIADGTFSHLTRLKEFSMVRNSLSHPPPDLPGAHLLRLYLQDNQITRIPLTAFAHLRKLERLDISNNQLRALTRGVFDNLSSLKQLTARNNPWLCDCGIKWVTEWLKDIPPALNVRGFMCQGPEQVRGMAVRELNLNLLSCPTTTPGLPAVLTPAPSTAGPPTEPPTPSSVPTRGGSYPPPSPASAASSKVPTVVVVPDRDGRDRERGTPPLSERLQLSVHFVNDTSIQVSWLSPAAAVTAYKLTWVKMGHSLVGGIVQERIVGGEQRHLSLGSLEPRSTYRICLVPLDAFSHRAAAEDTVCSEVATLASYLNNGSNTASSHEQTTPRSSLGSPLLLAGLIGGAVVFVLVVLLGVFCWHMHKKGRYASQKWKYNRGRRKDDYCEAGTKKDNSILEMTETSFQIVSLNNDQLLKGDFRLQPIYTPNGGLSYTDCHIPNNMRYCNSSVPDLEHCHT